MYCSECGQELLQTSVFCRHCGSRTDARREQPGQQVPHLQQNSSVGYSARINDPAFTRYLKNTKRWSVIFALALAVIAVTGFTIAGEVSDELDNPESLYIGLAIGGMFLLIALFQLLGRKRSTTWDGIVEDKRVTKKRRNRHDSDHSYSEIVTVYTVFIRRQDGKIHQIRNENDATVYNYYQVGDHVRHHGGLQSFEKHDKSRDSVIFCNACGTLNPIEADSCFRCKCPLLKGG